jgi:hypothetical protein
MKQVILAAVACLIIYSCTPTKMAVSDELNIAKDEYPVKGRQGLLINQKLSFGEFKTTKVKRSWTKGTSSRSSIGGYNDKLEYVNLISVDYINKKQTIHFGLSDGTLNSEVFCASKFNARDLNVGNNKNSIWNIALDIAGPGMESGNVFYVQVYVDDKDPWQLLLDNQASQAKAREYSGVFARSKSEFYTIRPVTKLDQKGRIRNMPFGSVGYEISNSKNEPVAAVSTMDNGVIFLKKAETGERFLLANLCAAILLQENIGE